LGPVGASVGSVFERAIKGVIMANPYDVERSWPDYFLEERKLFDEGQGTYKTGEHPVWTVHCPLGYIGNSTIIEGDDGLIVYDTGINADAGAHILSEIRKISDKPIKAIFYSHHHADHYSGTGSLVDIADVEAGNVTIYAWDNFEEEMANEFGAILPRQIMGVAYYGGPVLPPEELHHHGIGLHTLGGTAAYIPPTETLSEDTQLEIAGVKLNVFYTGGEAISEFGIHIPQFDMVIIADEFFTGIPNMHSIRGSKPRLPENYMKALDRVREIRPRWLLGSHIIPIEGKDTIYDEVTRYRDATQYLWDQSIRLINKGYTPVELQHALKDLPDHLNQPPYSVPTYGTPFTTVPEFFTGWVSWFDGDATNLLPTEPKTRATRFVELMGGGDAVLEAAKLAQADGDHQFAAELAQLVVRADPDNEDAKLVKAAALRARGYQELNPIARSWYLTGALELEGAFDPAVVLQEGMKNFESSATVRDTAKNWRYLLDAEAAGETRLVIGIRATDSGDELTVTLRNSVLSTEDGISADADAVVELVTADIVGRPNVSAVKTVDGDADAFGRLVAFLDTEPTIFYMHQR
jgi:alkyl sulfatase BDS1-like metallo-beta-lactamase superfamily hydrolase